MKLERFSHETIHIIARDHLPPPIGYVNPPGGFLRDKMIHYFDLPPWLAHERPAEVYTMGSCLIDPAIGQAGDTDTAMVILRFPSGMLCTIENSRRAIYGVDDRIEVFGAKGMLQSASPALVATLYGNGHPTRYSSQLLWGRKLRGRARCIHRHGRDEHRGFTIVTRRLTRPTHRRSSRRIVADKPTNRNQVRFVIGCQLN